jgi:hypothetical protein
MSEPKRVKECFALVCFVESDSITEQDMKVLIENPDAYTYEEVRVFYEKMKHKIPTAIDHVPVWRYACLHGNPIFYTADLCRMCKIADNDEDFFLLARIVQLGFDTQTKDGIPLKQVMGEGATEDFRSDFNECIKKEG